MAVINAFLATPITYASYSNPNITNDVDGFALPWYPYATSDILYIGAQPIAQNLPVDANPRTVSSFIAGGYVDDFYYRVHVLPSSTNLGNIVGSREVTVNLWNAYLDPRDVTALTATGDDGIDILTGDIPPYTMTPLQIGTYTFGVTADGGAIIDAVYTWTIESEQYTTSISGQRFVVFPFMPNYQSSGPVESLEWKTQVIRKSTGQEQRRALRTKPRRNFSYDISVFDANEQQHLRALMWGWLNRPFAIPIWVEETKLTSAVAAGSISIPLTTTDYRSFTIGQSAIFYGSFLDYEVIEIQGVTPTSIVAKIATTKTWPIDTKVYPVVLGHMPAVVPIKRHTNNVITASVSFETNPALTPSGITASSAPTIYDGLEVITYQPNWVGTIDDSFEYTFDTVDAQTGPIEWFANETYSRSLRRYQWLIEGEANISNFRAMLNRRFGQLKLCWIPTWSDDFELLETVSGVSNEMVVADRGFRRLVGVDTAHDRIMIIMKSGVTYYRRITAIGEQPISGNTLMNIDSTFGVNINPSDVFAIHCLDRCRLATDKVDTLWKTNDIITVESTFTTVPS